MLIENWCFKWRKWALNACANSVGMCTSNPTSATTSASHVFCKDCTIHELRKNLPWCLLFFFCGKRHQLHISN